VTGRVQGWVDRGYYPGAAVLVAKGNQVIYENVLGYTPDTQEQIRPVGQMARGGGHHVARGRGQLSLRRPSVQVASEIQKRSEKTKPPPALLSHTSGYRQYQPKGNPVDKYQTLAESVRTFCRWPPGHPPGRTV